MFSKSRFLLLFAFLLTTIFLWNNIFLYPIKIFVVYLHEISHAIAAIITGGQVHKITISINENGSTLTEGGNILIISLSGYIGSIVWGSSMLYSSLSNRFIYIICLAIGLTIPIFTYLYCYPEYTIVYWSLFFAGILFLLLPLLSKYLTRTILFFLGSVSCIYSIYDLKDFWNNSIMITDAGTIATIYSNNVTTQKILAYTIAVFISLLSIIIMYYIIKKILVHQAYLNKNNNQEKQNVEKQQTINVGKEEEN